MTRRIVRAWAAELPNAARAAYGTAVVAAGVVLGYWLILFTPAGPALAGAIR